MAESFTKTDTEVERHMGAGDVGERVVVSSTQREEKAVLGKVVRERWNTQRV